jgi:hypothetical protein
VTRGVKKVSLICTQVNEFRGGTLGHSQKSPRKDGRSEFSEEISRNSVSRQILGRSWEVTARSVEGVKAQEG